MQQSNAGQNRRKIVQFLWNILHNRTINSHSGVLNSIHHKKVLVIYRDIHHVSKKKTDPVDANNDVTISKICVPNFHKTGYETMLCECKHGLSTRLPISLDMSFFRIQCYFCERGQRQQL